MFNIAWGLVKVKENIRLTRVWEDLYIVFLTLLC